MMTLQELSGGRMRLGIGVGDSSLKTMGLAAAPRADLEAYAGTVRSLCRGETVPTQGGKMELTFGSVEQSTPIVIAGAGPKMLELAGIIGDGVMLSGAARNDSALASMLSHVQIGLESSSDATRSFQRVLGCAGAVDVDGHKAKVAVRPHVARGLLTARWERSDRAREASVIVKANYDYYSHMNPNARHAQLGHVHLAGERVIAGHLAAERLHQAILEAVERDDRQAALALEKRAGCRQCLFQGSLFVIYCHPHCLKHPGRRMPGLAVPQIGRAHV